MIKENFEADEFEALLEKHKTVIERFVYFKLTSRADADDVLQETYITAYQKFDMLRDKNSFKAWILRIAANKCNDYFRSCAKNLEIPIEDIVLSTLSHSRFGITEKSTVLETLDLLKTIDKQILFLFFFKNLPQSEIAAKLQIPIGTVKSRLHTAKQSFKSIYPNPPIIKVKGEEVMTKLPEYLPEYKITPSNEKPFSVKWEELMGWFIIPKIGEKLYWAMYDFPERKRSEITEIQVVGKASVHGIEGVEILAVEHNPAEFNSIGKAKSIERRFIAQLSDTHCRILAESHMEGEVKQFFTFLDGDEFLPNWGFGEDNCGNKTNISPKGLITRNNDVVTSKVNTATLDVVGRYTVDIKGKCYDTVCVMDIEQYNNGVATEQYIDKNGRTVLWRRFNHDEWAFSRYKKKWTEKLPDNERIIINGETYVHWYDCITDYIL